MKTAVIIIFIFLMFFTLNLYGNNALDFNGITDYASIPDDGLFDVAAVTIELWFYWDGSGTDVDFLTAKSTEELEIHLGGSTSNGIRFIPTSSVWIDTPAEAFTPGAWVHVACVYDPGQSLGKIYVNGNDMGAVNNGSNPLTTAIVHSDSDFRLGLRGNGSFPHNGKIDEVRIWNYARSQVEIQSAIWDPLTGSENGLIGYWRLDVLEDLGINGDGADDIRDYTANNLHGDTDGTVLTGGAPLHPFTEIADNLVDVSSGNDVVWGDYDNDGDLDILLTGGSIPGGRLSEVYRNDGDDTFTAINAGLPVFTGSSNAWGDYDNDGDLDLLLAGEEFPTELAISKICRNDGNDTFTDINAGLVGVEDSNVAWGDYDNDGDLDILLTGTNVSCDNLSEIYRNDGNDTFTAINAGLAGISEGSVAWGDYDNDGDLDILLAAGLPLGVYITRIYRNDSNDTFTDIDAGLQGVGFCSVAWGDYDNDGDLDILLAGDYYDGSWHTISKVYRNDSNDTFTDINAGLVGVKNCNVAWGDYDNDGDLDILLSGYGSSPTTKIYKNNGDDTFTEQTGINLAGLVNGSVAWGDYDNDGDLDILLAGYDFTSIYRNNAAIANAAPNAPEGLAAIADRNSLTFSWNAAADDETPSSGLTYNLRVGSTSGGDEVFSSMAQSDGWRKVPRLGSQNHNTEWTFDVTYPFQTSSVVYYWSVQAIDNCFAGSPFASEQVFNPVLYPCLINADEQRPTGTLLWETNSLDVIDSYQIQIDDNPDFSSPEVDDNVLPPNSRITELYAGVRLNTLPEYGNLADDTVYYWRMKPNYSNGWTSVFTDGTAHFFFNKINTAPDAPISGFTPANDEAVSSLTPILSWGNASDPDLSDNSDCLKYYIELDTTDTFVAPVYSVMTAFGQPYVQIESNLLAGYRYYYRVKTVDDELTESDWSAIQQFITLMPPQNVTITRNDACVMISWDSVPYKYRGIIYSVYSSNDPNAVFPDGWAVEAVNLNTTSWSDLSTSSCSKFYRVTAGSPFLESLLIKTGSEPACH